MILLQPFTGGQPVYFDLLTNQVNNTAIAPPSSTDETEPAAVSGCLSMTYDKRFALLYRQDDQLMLQIGHRLWQLNSRHTETSYRHHWQSRTTVFEIRDSIQHLELTYPAWWQHREPGASIQPEEDEQYDFFGYIWQVAANPALQEALLTHWR